MIDTHWCTHCWQWLPTDHFRPNDRLRSGVHSYCRVCAADLARDWRERNPVAIERYNRERREAYAEARGSLERVCVNPDCGGTFTPARVDAKTCSKECRDRLAYLRRRRSARREAAESVAGLRRH
jgi:predicted nucleic acid-binding Zn ribbon protein